ncbi:ABC transporter substrate-binding protein [Bradyrhizobium sp. 61]|uniref:ABC transporter substrate-binding protein n=1 Tax=unclassified Bradyrhizobium TaxID=2631580 RepID=UPI001FF83EF4|nr:MULTISPECIES: ABC transporter substrate-binding protein [unclassified Bradyrhizobium]MCK1274687.1 ABC transporter substrate-binding protein [Bradyrhizobium sp. 61]MCK1441681.1 ABC transporter substrate-binding protein [Bradyrhizobium sp. 48]MCK1465223.1 ABC transporter substrate-binding protein [Bradyrhizobium sp. 2]
MVTTTNDDIRGLIDRRRVLKAGAGLVALPFAGSPARAESGRGGTLTVITQGEPRTLVPLLDTNTQTRNISTKVTEGLLTYDASFTPRPLLATAWNASADGLEYAFTLRPGVKWHDGTDFTSADVQFSLQALQKVGPRGRISFANLDRVETPDALTAVVKLSKPTPYFLKALSAAESPIVPRHAYQPDNLDGSPNNNAPIGTGPFVFDEWKRGSHVSLRRNPNYWRPERPYLDRVVVKFVGDPAAASTALETGEADTSASISLADVKRLTESGKLVVSSQRDAYLNNAAVLEFSLDNQYLGQRAVRHAIARSIDRDFIRQWIYYGYASEIRSPIPEVLPAYFDPTTFNHPFNLDEANRLLDEAGLKRGSGGIRFALKLTFIPGAAFKATAGYLRSALGRAGIRVDIFDGDLGTFIKRVYNDRDFDLNLNGLGLLFDPTVGVQRIYWSDGIKHPLPYVNAAHYNNPAVDALFRQASTERDEARRADQFHQIQKITSDDLPALPLVALNTTVVSNARVHDLYNSVDLTAGDFSDAWLSG